MTTTWILVANASRADLYVNQGPHTGLELVKTYLHAASRERSQEMISDRPGRYETDGGAHGAFSQPTDPKQHEEDKFAAELAHELETGRTSNRYTRLILVASDPFMGKLNKHISAHVRDLTTDTIEKDYTNLDEKELAGHLEGCLFV
ncbi:MAG: host attachment protein [Sulfuriferula sp.]